MIIRRATRQRNRRWRRREKQRLDFCSLFLQDFVMLLTSSLPAGKYLRVGKLCTLTSSTSLAVESILAITTLSLSSYALPKSSQMGANCLQWPHHGASEIKKKKSVMKADILNKVKILQISIHDGDNKTNSTERDRLAKLNFDGF